MFKSATFSAVLALFLLTAASASANDKAGIYATIGGTLLSTELDLSSLEVANQPLDLGTEDVDVTFLNGRLGYRVNDFFAIEGEIGFGLGGDEFDRVVPIDVLGTPVNVDANISGDVDNYYIAFARGILPIADQFDIFARIGYGEATGEASVVGMVAGLTGAGSVSDNISGVAYGVGGQYNLTANDGIRADYIRLDDTDIISLAYSRRF